MNRELKNFSRQVVEVMPYLVREFARREDNHLTRGKISCPQLVTLDYINRHGRAHMVDIARILSTRMSSVSILVDRLIREKMLIRQRDPKDRRAVWVTITGKGRRVIAQILTQKRSSIAQVFSVLTARERSQYLSALLKIKQHFVREDLSKGCCK